MMAAIRSSVLVLFSEVAGWWVLKRVVQRCNGLCLDVRAYCTIIGEHSRYLGGGGLNNSKLT